VVHQATLVFDVIRKFVTVVLKESLNWHRSGVTQRTNRSAHDVVSDPTQAVEVLGAPLTVFDPVNHP
jgi:hypothetical protein